MNAGGLDNGHDTHTYLARYSLILWSLDDAAGLPACCYLPLGTATGLPVLKAAPGQATSLLQGQALARRGVGCEADRANRVVAGLEISRQT